jgi:hypothetical protein
MKLKFNLFEFDGWYYLEGKFDGSKIDLRFVEYTRKPTKEEIDRDKYTIIKAIQNYKNYV